MTDGPRIDPRMAVDLSPMKHKAPELTEEQMVERDKAKERAADQARAAEALAWDKKMKRSFKGILTRAERHRFLGI